MDADTLLPRASAGAMARDEGASAAVEFSLVLPFLLALLFGGLDLTDGVSAHRKLDLAAATVADLVARTQQVDGPYADNVSRASQAVMAPYDASRLTTVVSSVKVDGNGNATVVWSLGWNTSARSKGAAFPLATDLKVPNSTVIVSELSYSYQPVVGYLTGQLRFTDTASAPPRVITQASGIACTAPGC